MKHIALVTCTTYPQLSESDAILIEPLIKEGCISHVVPWDKKGIDWSLFDAIVLRSCWNYPAKYSQFIDWLSENNTQICNPANIVKWNAHKSYLFDLEKRGIPIIPTVAAGNKHGWSEFVAKPVVGNGARGVTRSPKTGEFLWQQFAPEVMTEGEYSFVFIDGKLTHAVLKTPKKGDFRANVQFGATERLITPSKTLVEQARRVLHALDTNLLYARVDGINRNGKLLLMELELIEPHLFFDMNPKAAEIFAKTLKHHG